MFIFRYGKSMSTTGPPPPIPYDAETQSARIEAATAYLQSALEILIEAQEHETLAGICWDTTLLEKLKRMTFATKLMCEEIAANIINIDVSD